MVDTWVKMRPVNRITKFRTLGFEEMNSPEDHVSEHVQEKEDYNYSRTSQLQKTIAQSTLQAE